MSNYKELKKATIEAGKEKGDAGIAKGEQRVRELQSVKSLIDSMYFKDEIDSAQADMLERSYLQAGKEAHQREVKDVVDSAKDDLERNKADIVAERLNVENAIDKVGDMKGATDLARNEASNVERNLQKSAAEHGRMETLTENIETEQESKSRNILNRIENIFG